MRKRELKWLLVALQINQIPNEQTTIAASIKNGNHESFDDDSESSSVDECGHATALPIIKQKKFLSRKTVITTHELSISFVKMTTDQIPLCAKQVLEVLKKCKKIVKYVKKADINNDIKEDGGGTLHQSCVVRWLSMSNLLESIRWFRERLLKLVDELCVIDVHHYCCHKYVREQLKIIRNVQSSSETLQQTADSHPKRSKTADSIFVCFKDDYSHGFRENNAECFEYESDEYEFCEKQSDELDRYLVMQIDKLSVTDNPLDF
ncbi:unnamed protein product [Adineta steineri]|uniref:Uncharacterized protein n=1 Tax=Adineta steineri TaxID=433720 RepID=A0A814J9Z5_9BILA|nr:unnamed protein product [Adineta steineri]